MCFKIPENVDFVLKTLENAGFKAYIVGGCVRDILCKKTPADYDITTNALPDEIKSLFKHTADTGIKHGTVTVIIEKTPIEVTTFRTESGYSDSRHPDTVNFVDDVTLDLSRRDFTVNSICYNPRTGIVDPFGGSDDINRKILRAVGDPDRRFKEDALRIMRLFRFSGTLGFSIEKQTLDAAYKNADLLQNVSRERITAELIKASSGSEFYELEAFLKIGALRFCGIDGGEICKNGCLPDIAELRIFALLYPISRNLYDTSKELKLSNSITEHLAKLKAIAEAPLPKTRGDIKRLLRDYGIDAVNQGVIYKKTIQHQDTEYIEAELESILKSGEPYKISELAVNGNDVLKLGIPPTDIGKTLDYLNEKVIDDPALNRKSELLKLINLM